MKMQTMVMVGALLMTTVASASPERYLDGPPVEGNRVKICNWLQDQQRSAPTPFLQKQLRSVVHNECGWRFVSPLAFYEGSVNNIPKGLGHVFSTYSAKQKYSYICYNNICR